MLSKMRSFTSMTSDQLRIGTLSILSQYDLMLLLNKFQDDYPKIQLSVTETDDKELLDGFSCGKYDLILAREGMIDKEQYHFLPVAKDRLSVMLPDSHPL
ncbi:substrate-binding domain-containing protein [Lachnospiraceae bacterium SGI.085]